ncbi:MAG: prepilin-type N-terminal cleavage/methylation domain-containing protein, partial [Chloroflexi bacterium]|nr:prepilin-type N-terminal cleavage/methylation domain-containing protein [Chloroflexota bacterium]
MVQRTASRMGQRGFTLVELLAVMAIMGILAGVVAGAVVGLGSKGQLTRLQGDRNTIAKSADRFFTDAFPQTYPVVDIDTNGDGEVDELDDLVSVAGDLNVRLIDFDAIIPQNATLSFVPDFLKEVPDSAALVSWRVDQATGNVFFTEDGAALVRPSLARFDVKAKDTSRSQEGASVQSDHVFTLTMRQGEAPINTIEMTIPAGYVIGGQQLTEGAVVGSLAITF